MINLNRKIINVLYACTIINICQVNLHALLQDMVCKILVIFDLPKKPWYCTGIYIQPLLTQTYVFVVNTINYTIIKAFKGSWVTKNKGFILLSISIFLILHFHVFVVKYFYNCNGF